MIQWLGITLVDVGHARAVLTAWTNAPGNPKPVPSYGFTFPSLDWTQQDGVVLHAFAVWWNGAGYVPKIAEGAGAPLQAALTDAHLAALDKWAAGAVPLPPVVDVPASKALLVLWGKTDGAGLVPADYGAQTGDLPTSPWTKRDGQALMAFGKWSTPPISGSTFTTEYGVALKAWFATRVQQIPGGWVAPPATTPGGPPAKPSPAPAPLPAPGPGADKPPPTTFPIAPVPDRTMTYVLGGLALAVVGGLWLWMARTPRAAVPPSGPQENPAKRKPVKKKHPTVTRPFRPLGSDSFVLQRFTDGSYRAALYEDAVRWSGFSDVPEVRSFAWSRMPSEHGATAMEAAQKLEAKVGRGLQPWSYQEIDALKGIVPPSGPQENPKKEKLKIVIAWLVDEVEVVSSGRRDIGERPTFRDVKVPRAAMWTNKGTEQDVEKARVYAAKEGYQVFVYPTSERDPLGRARREIAGRAMT